MGMYTKKINEALGLEEKLNNVFYGNYKGYEVTVVVVQQIFVHLNFHSNGNVKAKALKIFHNTSTTAMTNVEVSAYGISAVVNGMTFKSALKKVVEKLDATIAFLSENEARGVGYCCCCGETDEMLKTIRINDIYVSLDSKCLSEVESAAEAEEAIYNEQPNNYLKGTLGALLGAAIGAIAWYILYMLGFLSALTAVLAVFLGNFFYVKFGGKANTVKNIIVAVVSLVVLVLTCLLLYVDLCNAVIIENNLNMTAFEFIFENAEIKEAFIHDMLMNVVFTIIGVFAQIGYTKKKDQTSRTTVSR